MQSLTQQEAAERSALLAVERYDVAVDLSEVPQGTNVRTESTVTFTCRRPGAVSFVDCMAEVESAVLNGVPLPAAVEGRIELADLQADNVLTVVVRASTEGAQGFCRAVDPADGSVYAFTDFTPDYARYAWACFDQPDLKAPWVFTVTAPAGWKVLSNSKGEQDGECWTFAATPPLSTYNTVVNAGPYYEIRRDGAGHDLGLFARQSLKEPLERDADELFTLTTQGLEFFTEQFGMPFPQHKYDQVFTPEFPGAMENFGCVTWMDWFLRHSTPTRAEWDRFSRYLLHELAHMWFGNIVTMRWWDDLWLNEAFAEFASNWVAVRATSYQDAWTTHLVSERLKAYYVDQGPTTHPIRQPVPDVAAAEAIFDAITYPKGAAALQQLMTYVGESAFAKGLAAYFAKHAWGNSTLQDLIDALAAASGRDLDRWRTGWLETAGTDRLTLEGDVLVATGLPRPHVLGIGAYARQGETLERIQLVEVETDGERTQVDLPAADFYLVNDDELTFASTRPADTSTYFTDAARLPTALSRSVAVTTAWDMLLNGEASATEIVDCLTGVLAVETSASVVEPFLNLAVEAASLWSSPDEQTALLRRVAATCRALGSEYRKGSLRSFARTAANVEQVEWLQLEAGEDVDLQWRALVRKAQLGVPVAAAADALLAKDPDPEAWVSRLQVQAATPDAADKAAVWQKLVTERAVPLASVHQVATPFWSAGQDDLLTPYAERFLELVPNFYDGGAMPAMTFTKALFPLYGVDGAYADRADALAAQSVPVIRTNLLDRSDRLRRMLRSRGVS